MRATLANLMTPANELEHRQVSPVAVQVEGVPGGTVELAYIDYGSTRDAAAEQARLTRYELEVRVPRRGLASARSSQR